MRRWLLAVGAAGAALALLAGGAAEAQQRTRVTIYTALENEQLQPFKQAIEADVPGVEVVWVRDSTGVITARVLAERENPRADLVMGLYASSLLLFKAMNLLEPYEAQGAPALKPAFRDGQAPAAWTGMDAAIAALCFNTAEAKRANVPAPATWNDLTKPEFRGRLVMPHPASSGTGYMVVSMWLQSMGEEAGWKYMDALHENVAVYTHSGSAPCVQAARGERVAGISLDMRGAAERTRGAPLEVIIPTDGTGWDLEAVAIMKGTRNPDAARRIADWAATRRASELYSRWYPVVAYPGVENVPQNYPAHAEERMFRNDFAWMAANRERILAEWSRRYEAKAAPRN